MLGLAWLDTLNLLDVFNYYLIVGFIASTAINVRRYRAFFGLLCGFPSRWPKLLELVNRHRTIFFGWPTLLAIGLAFILMLSNSLAIRLNMDAGQGDFRSTLGALVAAGSRPPGGWADAPF
jgi:hypothetical protein